MIDPPIRASDRDIVSGVADASGRVSRRALLGSCAGWILAPAAGAFATRARAESPAAEPPAAPAAEKGVESHGVAMHGDPALAADFAHLPYANPQAPKGGRLLLGMPGTFDGLNPFNLKAGTAAHGLIGNVFQTLMQRSTDEPFTLYGLIARSIETDAARSYATFRLDPRARFSDGKPVTAKDVLFSFDLLRTKGRPQHRAAFSLVKGVSAPDDMTVRYDLTGVGDRELPMILALMPVLASHVVDAATFNESTFAVPVGSGPYRVVEVKPGESVRMERQRDYWAADLPIHRGLYNFDEIRIDYSRDAATLFEAMKAGLIDYREETDPTRWLGSYDFPAIADGRTIRKSAPLGGAKGMQGFAFNTRRAVFADVRVREALGLMFDFEWVNARLYGGLYRRTRSFFDESELSATGRPADARERALLAQWPGAVREDILEGRWAPPMTDGSGRDREQARRALELFAQAGYRVVDGELRHAASGAPFTFEIMVTEREQERLSLVYLNALRRIGVKARVRQVDLVQYQRRRQKFDFDMMIGFWLTSNSPGNEQRNRWSSASADQESSFNLAGARSPALDGLIAAMLAAVDPQDFVAAVRAFDRVLQSGFYIIPLFHKPDQWMAYTHALAYPERLPRYASPLFGQTLETWWRKPA